MIISLSTGCITYNKIHDFCLRLACVICIQHTNLLITGCCVDTATSNVSNISSLLESTNAVPVIKSRSMTFIKSITSLHNISVTSRAAAASARTPNDNITTCATLIPTTARNKENKGN